MASKEHVARIQQELREAGMSKYGFLKLTTNYLPSIIHDNEHIKGVVYGRLEGTIDSVMLVATDRRVLFLDCRPFYRDWDEITYEVVAGVKTTIAGPFAGLVLHTRVKDYAIKYVNLKCTKKFVEYIQSFIERQKTQTDLLKENEKEKTSYQKYRIKHDKSTNRPHSNEDTTILDNTAVLSTVDSAGKPYSSVIHYIIDKSENFYFVTKSDTTKAQNIEHSPDVALTIHPSDSLKVLYILGQAELIRDKDLSKQVFEHIVEPKQYSEGVKLPPITKLKSGAYVAYKITPTDRKYLDYSTTSW